MPARPAHAIFVDDAGTRHRRVRALLLLAALVSAAVLATVVLALVGAVHLPGLSDPAPAASRAGRVAVRAVLPAAPGVRPGGGPGALVIGSPNPRVGELLARSSAPTSPVAPSASPSRGRTAPTPQAGAASSTAGPSSHPTHPGPPTVPAGSPSVTHPPHPTHTANPTHTAHPTPTPHSTRARTSHPAPARTSHPAHPTQARLSPGRPTRTTSAPPAA